MQIIKDKVGNIVKYPAFMPGQTPETIVDFKHHVLTMLRTGGACAVWLSDTVIHNLSQEEQGLYTRGYHILVYEDIMADLTDQQREAVLCHERAHILLGHIPRVEEVLKPGEEQKILENEQYELHADWCAARRHGKVAMREGLVRILDTTSRMTARVGVLRGKITPDQETGFAAKMLEASLSEKTTAARLKALS